jgi:hypothetical protein
MTAGTVTYMTAQTVTRLIPAEYAPRADRKRELEDLADLVTLGTPPSERSVRLQVLAWASERWSPQAAMQRWAWLIDEVDRRQAVEAGEPCTRGVSAQMCREDEAAALADLLDGTDHYRGDRTTMGA